MIGKCSCLGLLCVLGLTMGGCKPTSGGVTTTAAAITSDTDKPVNSQATVAFTVAFDQAVSGFGDSLADVRINYDGTTGAQMAIEAIDGRTYRVRVSGVTGDGSYTLTVLADAAQDAAGNPSTEVTSKRIVVDNSPPVVSVDLTPTNDTTPRLTGKVNELTVIITVTIAGKTYTAVNNGDGTWTLADNVISPALPIGTHDVVLTATDLAGNVYQGTTTNVVLIDLVAPVGTINPLTTNKRRPHLTGTVDDPTAIVTVRIGTLVLGSSTAGNNTWALDSQVDVPDGTYQMIAATRDPAGNSSESTATLILDATAPTVTVNNLWTADTTPPLSGTINDPTATIKVTVAGQTFTVANNAGTWSLPDGAINPPLAPGWYDVIAAATDTFGNVGTDTTTTDLRVTEAPLMSGASLAEDNSYMDITFDQPVYADLAHSQPINTSSLVLFFARNDDVVTGVTISSLSNQAGGSLLGSDSVRVHFSLAGQPTLGLGIINVQAVKDLIWNGQGQVATSAASGDFRLHDPRNLLKYYEWSFDRFFDDSYSVSWRVVNASGTLALFHSGVRSALFANPTTLYADRSITMPNDSNTQHYIHVQPETSYKVSAYVYVKSMTTGVAGDTAIRLELKMGRTGNTLLPDVSRSSSLGVPSMNAWQKVEFTTKTPPDSNGTAWATVQVCDTSPNDSDVYIDDLRVEAMP